MIGPVFQPVDILQGVTTGNGVTEMNSVRQLIQVVANPSQLATQLTEFTADRSATMVRQDCILQQRSDPVSGCGMAKKPGALAPPCQFIGRRTHGQAGRSDTGWR
ncbi:hypothetical protein AA3266_2490 [Gluconobacter kondonii NBRC 3266]|nr:hypothetical protein AA3266_2490 [Gluconobacter kondonii NBRC 3266]